jgi:hypothetical protein
MGFLDLFKKDYEYPSDEIAKFGGLPQNTLYCYVSSTFLDGLINYVKPFKAFMIHRYVELPKEKYMDIFLEALKDQAHTNYSNAFVVVRKKIEIKHFSEEITVLAEGGGSYWCFNYDPDVSDCLIARCSTKLVTKEEFGSQFLAYIKDRELEATEIPIPYGWVSY